MHGAGRDPHRHVIECGEAAKALGQLIGFQRHGAGGDGHDRVRDHAIASSTAAEAACAPNTPPCIVIIFNAASWLPWSVAAVQSDSARHSKPRSLASRIVVCTQTSVVMPVRTRLTMPRVRRISSRSVAQKEPLPGLSMMVSPG